MTPATTRNRHLRPAVVGPASALTVASLATSVTGRSTATFILSGLAIIPLAAVLGRATEDLAAHAGPRIGGLVNATLGNAAEIIIGILLVVRGELAVVEASITGSVLANLLLVLGMSFLAAGLRTERVQFSSQAASALIASTALAVAGMLLPSIYAHHAEFSTDFRRESISLGVAAVLVMIYAATLGYTLTKNRDVLRPVEDNDAAPRPTWPLRAVLATLAVTAAVIAVESHLLVDALDPTLRSWGISQTWAGLVLIAVIGNAAEHSSAVMMAMRDRVDVAIDIAVGSSAQVALLVTPILVLTGAVSGHHLQLTFTTFELGALAIAVSVVALLTLDGESNWLEGTQLVALYVIIAISAFFIGKA